MKLPHAMRALTLTGWIAATLTTFIVGLLLWAAATHTGFPT